MKPTKNAVFATVATLALSLATSAFAASHAAKMSVMAEDQAIDGSVTASNVMAADDGWLVVHKTEDGMKPGPVIGHAMVKAGENTDVTADLSEEVAAGDKLMLMLHGEDGGMKEGEFEYTLGAKEDGPVKMDGELVMSVVTAQ